MNLNDRVVQATDDSALWFPHLVDDVTYSLLGLNGEAGEAAEEYKHWWRSEKTLLDQATRERIGLEIVDVLVYAFKLSGQLGLDLEDLYDRKREYNVNRFRPVGARRGADRSDQES